MPTAMSAFIPTRTVDSSVTTNVKIYMHTVQDQSISTSIEKKNSLKVAVTSDTPKKQSVPTNNTAL